MEFGYSYTEAQDRFRREVCAWLDANLPSESAVAGELGDTGFGNWEDWKAFLRLMGEKGWLAVTEPVELGGLGASQDLAAVLLDELQSRGLSRLLDGGASSLRRALRGWGTQEQKQQLLSPVARGRVIIWHTLVEPEIVPDPGDLGVEAFEDGDDYVLNGEGRFVGPGPWPDYLWTLALVDRTVPAVDATAGFLVSTSLKGIVVTTPRQLVPGEAHRVTFNQTRVPRYCILGPDGEGRDLMHSALLAESAAGRPASSDPEVADLLQYARETSREGVLLSEEPVLQQLQMEVYISSRIVRLFRMRDAWMRATGRQLTYHSAQTRLWEKRTAARLSEVVRQVAGIYALLDHRDLRAPAQGKFELQQRRSLACQDTPGSMGGYEEVMARHLGLARIEESELPALSLGNLAGAN